MTTRKQNEEYVDYMKRIIRMCADKQISYSEMGDALLGDLNCYSAENLRKAFYVLEKICNIINNEIIKDFKEDPKISKEIEKLEKLKDEVFKERCKIQALNLEGNRYKRQDARFELFYGNISKVIQSLTPPVFERLNTSNNEKKYVLGFGDIHYGANFESINNKYSIEECKRRFEILLSETEKYVTNNCISKLKAINVSDNIQGILRMTDLQLNEIPVVEAVVGISRLIAEFLNELSKVCKIEYYHVPMANHAQTRNLGSKASELVQEDMEKIIVNYISDLVKNNERISVISNVGKDYVDFKIFDFECFATHGHQFKSTKDCIKDMSNIHRKFYSYAFVGHTHSANEIIVGEENYNNMEVLTIPAFIGSCPYADSLFVGSKAMAKIYEFDSVYGHVGSKNIILN